MILTFKREHYSPFDKNRALNSVCLCGGGGSRYILGEWRFFMVGGVEWRYILVGCKWVNIFYGRAGVNGGIFWVDDVNGDIFWVGGDEWTFFIGWCG